MDYVLFCSGFLLLLFFVKFQSLKTIWKVVQDLFALAGYRGRSFMKLFSVLTFFFRTKHGRRAFFHFSMLLCYVELGKENKFTFFTF
jgi:hypothetical protein